MLEQRFGRSLLQVDKQSFELHNWLNVNNYRLCCVMENTEIWLADTKNKMTFMFADRALCSYLATFAITPPEGK